MSNDMEFETEKGMQPQDQSKMATPAALPMSEIQMRIAADRPRNEFAIGERILKELQKYGEYADEGFYSIPYKDKKKGIIHFVEGLSIRAAEHMWSRWGNCTVADRVADERHDKIMVQGMFFDYEQGLLNLSDLEVSKFSKGSNYKLGEDMLRLGVAAGKQKVKRNAFLGSIPIWIKRSYLETCQNLTLIRPGADKKTFKDRVADASAYFERTYKLKKTDMPELLEKINEAYPGIDDQTMLRYLLGLKTSLKFGDVSTDFVFGEEKKEIDMPKEKAPADKKQQEVVAK